MSRQFLVLVLLMKGISDLSSAEIIITPTGEDDAVLIQIALGAIQAGDTLRPIAVFLPSMLLYPAALVHHPCRRSVQILFMGWYISGMLFFPRLK